MIREKIGRAFNVFTLFLMGALTPLTLAILVSWNSLPGQVTYPLKLGLENIAVFGAQINSQWEAEMRLTILDRRYREARFLLEEQASTQGYEEFLKTARATEEEVLGIKDRKLRERYREELAEDLRRYNRELEALISELEEK